LKSGFQFDTRDKTVLLPKIFSAYPEIRSGMSTKLGNRNQTGFEMNLSYKVGDDPAIVETNRKSFLSLMGISIIELASPLQSHSNYVRIVDVPGEYAECEALITNASGVALVVSVADCVPIFLFDPIKKAIGNVHAG